MISKYQTKKLEATGVKLVKALEIAYARGRVG
jgi:hypothetical protein